jgi:hypothetical protein
MRCMQLLVCNVMTGEAKRRYTVSHTLSSSSTQISFRLDTGRVRGRDGMQIQDSLEHTQPSAHTPLNSCETDQPSL